MSTQARRTALVTGASAGIGQAFARQLAASGHDLLLTARRRDRLESLRAELSQGRDLRIEVIPADLSDPAAPAALFDEIARRGLQVDVLVNNAGFSVPSTYTQTTWKQQADVLQVLVTAVAHLCHLFLPGMVERRYGRVLNIASLAGLVHSAPGATLYAASKSFVIKMSESLALEVAGSGVNVTAVCPGFTLSEFHDVNGMRARVSTLPSVMWMDADAVAREGLAAADQGRAVAVTGAVNRVIAGTMKHLPEPIARRLVRRQAKRFRDV